MDYYLILLSFPPGQIRWQTCLISSMIVIPCLTASCIFIISRIIHLHLLATSPSSAPILFTSRCGLKKERIPWWKKNPEGKGKGERRKGEGKKEREISWRTPASL